MVYVRHVRPALVEAGLPLLVQAVVDGDVIFAGAGDELGAGGRCRPAGENTTVVNRA